MSWQLGVGITEFFLLTLVSLRSTAYGHDEARCDAILGPVVQCGKTSHLFTLRNMED